MSPEQFEQLLSDQLTPALQQIEQQSVQLEALKRQLEEQQVQTYDLLSHIDERLQDKEKPPVPIAQAWKPLGFKSAEGLRGAIRRNVYTIERGEILRRGASILVNIQTCLESGYTPIHRRRSA